MGVVMEKRADEGMMAIKGDHESRLVAGVSVLDIGAPVDEHADDFVMTSFSGSHESSPAVL